MFVGICPTDSVGADEKSLEMGVLAEFLEKSRT